MKTITVPKGTRQLIISLRTERNYFSVTGEISTEQQRKRGDCDCCGCIHDEILAARPDLAPAIALHLSSLDGIPMHAEANGWYWLAGAAGGRGERYHGGADKTPDQCTEILADHLRISLDDARAMVANPPSRQAFKSYIENCKPRWKAEAEAVLPMFNA